MSKIITLQIKLVEEDYNQLVETKGEDTTWSDFILTLVRSK